MQLRGGVGTPYEARIYYEFPIAIVGQARAEEFGQIFIKTVLDQLPTEAVRSTTFAPLAGDPSNN